MELRRKVVSHFTTSWPTPTFTPTKDDNDTLGNCVTLTPLTSRFAALQWHTGRRLRPHAGEEVG